MTKRLKTTLLIIFSAVLLLATCLFAFPQFSVFADAPVTAPKEDLNDDMNDAGESGKGNQSFYLNEGASLYLGTEEDDKAFYNGNYSLRFRLNLDNTKHENLLDWGDNVDNALFDWNETLSKGYFKYTFTLYRVKDFSENSAYALEELTVLIELAGNVNNPRLRRWILRKPLAVKTEAFSVWSDLIPKNPEYPVQYVFGISDYPYYAPENDFYYSIMYEEYINAGYEVLYVHEMTEGGLFVDGRTYGNVVVDVDSPFNKYLVDFKYEVKEITRDNVNMKNEASYGVTAKGKGGCTSSTRSVFDILEKANTAGELESLFAQYVDEDHEKAVAYAEKILFNTEVKKVKLYYLKQIEGTPFAEKVYEEVEIKVTDGTIIHQDDVADALGNNVLRCLNSFSKEPIYDDKTNSFYLEYLDTVWVRAILEDGKWQDFFFDINRSYYETYNTFVQAGLLPAGLYERQLNEMKIDYPQLDVYDADEIYGYFGFVVTPNEHSLDKAFHEMFGNGTSACGLLNYFESETLALNKNQYNELTASFGYHWLEKLWNSLFVSVTDLFEEKPATYHLFYCDGLDRTSAVLGKGGQTTPNQGGTLEETGKDALEDLGDFVGGAWTDIVDGANTLWDTLTTPFKSSTNIVIFVIVGVAVILILRKLGVKMPKRSSGSKKKKKK